MGWALDMFENELASVGIYPVQQNSYHYDNDIDDFIKMESFNSSFKNQKEESKMEVKIALCYFSGGSKLYAFKTIETNLKLGDKVIVNANDDFSVVTFIDYARTSEMQSKATKWLVQKIDIEEFKEKVKKLEKTSL